MRIVAAFLLLTVFAGLAIFLTFTSSWGSLLIPQAAANEAAVAVEEPTPMPDWEGKFVVETNQPVVLRTDPFVAAQAAGLLRKGEKVALKGCDVSGLWCQTEAGEWFVSYMVGTLPEGLPVLEGVKVQAAPTVAPLVPTADPAALMPTATPAAASVLLMLPTPTPAPTVLPQAIVADAANLRAGPGTSYAIVGSANFGESLSLAGRTDNGEWFQTDGGAWIAGFLLSDPPAGLPVVDANADEAAAEAGQIVEPELASPPVSDGANEAVDSTTTTDELSVEAEK
ncbi:MAG: SH3 domain-containing protein [Caldilinea sp.]|nr:SH3 domain-containing protein [Caldilinea sp.]